MTPYYEARGVAIYHGDAREIVADLTFDVVVTDPPYGCSATTGRGGNFDGFSIRGDANTECRDWIISATNGPFAVFGSPRVPRPPCKSVLIWSKGEHTGMGDLSFPWKPDFEEIYINGPGWRGPRETSVLRYMSRTDSNRHHPTEKPVALMAHLIHRAPPGTILDPFMGSGSTLVAAKEMGRRAIGIEIEERYCEIAAKRLEGCAMLPFSETVTETQHAFTPQEPAS